MKTFLKLLILIVIVLIPKNNIGQCDSDDFMDKCSSSLGGYTFLKSFNVNSKKADDKHEYQYVFSKGSGYVIVVCDQNTPGNKMIVNLYDRNHKFVASSFNKQNKKHYPSITYPCSATGVYYIETAFESGSGCGVSIIGFDKKK